MENTEGNVAPQNPAPAQNTGAGGETTPQAAPQQVAGDNSMLMSILAYIGVLVIIPLLMEKENMAVRFHVRQGLVLLVIELIAWVVAEWMFLLAFPMGIVNIGALILSIIGIVNVVQKRQQPLPLVGQFAEHFKV